MLDMVWKETEKFMERNVDYFEERYDKYDDFIMLI